MSIAAPILCVLLAAIQYNGRVYDPSTGFHDYGARMYWPEIGRFISVDSAGPSLANPLSFLIGVTAGLGATMLADSAASSAAAATAADTGAAAAGAGTGAATAVGLGPGAAGVGQFVDKVVNSNMGHAAERAVERAGFSTIQEARAALQQFGSAIQRAGTLPATAIQDTAHADRVIVPGLGQGGAVVYQVSEQATVRRAEALWTSKDVAEFLQVSLRWVEKQRALGVLPCLALPGRRLVRYNPEAIRDWALQRATTVQGNFR